MKFSRFFGHSTLLPLAFLMLLGVATLHSGCSGKTVDESDPASLFKDAEEDVENDRYQIAIEKFRTIKNKFPYSNYSVDAQLKLADVYFLQESFAEAALSYEAFKDLHPKHPKVNYAMFRIGKSYFQDIPSPIARDLSSGTRALEAYDAYLRRFPNDPNSAEAKKDVEQIRKLLADKELYIANFYYIRDVADSARTRFEKIVAMYPETDAAKEAKQKLEKLPPASPRKTAPTPED